MRLINIHTLQLKEYLPGACPPYAILSHTWGKEEVSFTDMLTLSQDVLQTRLGYQKIVDFCKAIRDGHLTDYTVTSTWNDMETRPQLKVVSYVWVDTCCIDKTSSAELSEAINSMFMWYQQAEYCVAFLNDYPPSPPVLGPPRRMVGLTGTDSVVFTTCRWFRRGWTLQELLAPEIVIFVDKNWTALGDKTTLGEPVCEASGIQQQALIVQRWREPGLQEPCIATRMSWAANRETTRPEDMAYCLLGLFSVNMPLLYGEGGEKAFIRLQEEILKESEDQSIYAWNPASDKRQSFATYKQYGLLSIHPSEFRDAGELEYVPDYEREPHTVTTRGIRVHMPVLEGRDHSHRTLVLSCKDTSTAMPRYIGVPLVHIPDGMVYSGNLVQSGSRDQNGRIGRDRFSRERTSCRFIDIATAGQSQVRSMYLLKRTTNQRFATGGTRVYVKGHVDAVGLRGPSGLIAKGHKFYHPANALFLSETRGDLVTAHISPDQWYTQRDKIGSDAWKWQIFDSEQDIRLTAMFWSNADDTLVKDSFMLIVERNMASVGRLFVRLVNLHCSGPLTPADAARLKDENWDAPPAVNSRASIVVKVEEKKRTSSFFKMESPLKELEISAEVIEENVQGFSVDSQASCIVMLRCKSLRV